MAGKATYSDTLPTLKDHIRQLIGDTACGSGDGPHLYTDPEIQAKLDSFGWAEALAQLALGARGKYTHSPIKLNQGNGGASVEFDFDYLERLADRARKGEIAQPGVARKSPGGRVAQLTAPDTSVLIVDIPCPRRRDYR